jgi:hypothetical protein
VEHRLHDRFLGGVLGQRRRADHPATQRQHQRAVLVDQACERRAVAGPRPPHQDRVVVLGQCRHRLRR